MANPRRRTPRLAGFDYRRPGAYFVSICTHQRRCLFGRVVDDTVLLSDEGIIVEEEWWRTAEGRRYVTLDSHVVMPNHVHGLIVIQDEVPDVAAGPRRRSLASIVGSFKAAAARRIGLLHRQAGPIVWQRSFHERVVRDHNELNRVREYISNNPLRWRRHTSSWR
jgi:putative transposase